MAIAITYLEAMPKGRPRNSVTVIDRRGRDLFTYAKVHTCVFDAPECALAPGDEFFTAELETKTGPVNVGAMICYDREFPESARLLMLQGAEIILTPNACDLTGNFGRLRVDQFKARAFENMVGVAMANYPAPRLDGNSCAFNPDGGLVVQAGASEGVFLADFNLDWLREWRQTETWGNAFRRPDCYGALTSAEVREPFIRERKT
jgi:predicted amidohydrolase